MWVCQTSCVGAWGVIHKIPKFCNLASPGSLFEIGHVAEKSMHSRINRYMHRWYVLTKKHKKVEFAVFSRTHTPLATFFFLRVFFIRFISFCLSSYQITGKQYQTSFRCCYCFPNFGRSSRKKLLHTGSRYGIFDPYFIF